jgi:hypothetical protein
LVVAQTSETAARGGGAIAGAVAALLGLLLMDAAAYAGHGPEMRGAVVGLWVSVVNLLSAAI